MDSILMVLFDFSDPKITALFSPIGDQVMGGISVGLMKQSMESAVFTGEVSLENSGGFASVRSFPGEYDLSGYEGIEVMARGDGKTYKFSVTLDASLNPVVYRARFIPQADIWTETRIPFKEFEPTFRGDIISAAPPFDPSKITTFGVLISDKQEGKFRLGIKRISSY